MNPRLALIGLAVAATAFAGCATTEYSQLSGRRYHLTPIDTYPLLILDVDGRSTTRSPVLVDPGTRVVRVQAPPGGAGLREVRSVSLDVPPCTRMYLVAVKSNRLASDFDVKVDHQESIGSCAPRVAQK